LCSLDKDFCAGTVQAPKPNGKMEGQKFEVSFNGKTDSTTVKDWMQSVQDGKSPDRLPEIDQVLDGSIGGLKDALENVFNTNRAVPLFEFRRLARVKVGDMADSVDKYEQAIIAYHKANTKPPARFLRNRRDTEFSKIKRQDSPACAAPASSTAAAPPPPPLPPPPPPATDSCDVSYQVVDDFFEIRGKNFDDTKLGTNGDGLKGNIKHCGALTAWQFQQMPHDTTYDWYASGKLPIGTKSCVGSETENSGGGSLGNCHGAGKH